MDVLLRAALAATMCATSAAARPLHEFDGSQKDGYASAVRSLAADANGLVFGATDCGTRLRAFPCSGWGAIFTLSRHPDRFTIIHSFDGETDGFQAPNPLVVTANDTVFGTSNGESGDQLVADGLVWQLTPPQAAGDAWTYTVIHQFNEIVDGADVVGGLVTDSNGDLFGQTLYSNEYGRGWVFELTPPAAGATSWGETLLHQFRNNQQSEVPVILSRDEQHVYGIVTVHKGGPAHSLFQIKNTSHGWVYEIVYTFPSPLNRFSNVVIDDHRDVFGYAEFAGNHVNRTGRFFELSPPPAGGSGWTYREIFTFPQSGPPTTVTGTIVLSHGTLVADAYSKEDGASLFRLNNVRSGSPQFQSIPVEGLGSGLVGGGVFPGPGSSVLGTFYQASGGADGFAYIAPIPAAGAH